MDSDIDYAVTPTLLRLSCGPWIRIFGFHRLAALEPNPPMDPDIDYGRFNTGSGLA